MRPALVLLALLVLAPHASAQAGVRILDAEVPERTLAGLPFEARVTLRNDGESRNVTMLAALYRWEEGKEPCGPANGPHFRTFTHLMQESIRLEEGATLVYPEVGERWLQRYAREHVAPGDERAELCFFVARQASTATIQYEAFHSVPLVTRGENTPPVARFEAPAFIEAAQPARFQASGEDADGDAVSFRWDFGHLNASGRAVAEGPSPVHRFYPAGSYVVTLIASDGFEETRVQETVEVAPAGSAPVATERQERASLPGLIAPAALLVALALRRFR